MNQPFPNDHRRTPHLAALFASTNSPRSDISPEALDDAEFGAVTIRRNKNSRSVRLRMMPAGELIVTMPPRVALVHAVELIESSRHDIRTWRAQHLERNPVLKHGSRVGHSHTLELLASSSRTIKGRLSGLTIEITYPETVSPENASVQRCAKTYISKALQKEARAYLPRRLKYLADTHGFHYERVRFGTQKGRWGSCSSKGTISLNVGLMNQSLEEIDYVLIHELCHTKHMNHSEDFWKLVAMCMPDFKTYRKSLKNTQPTH